MNFQIYGPFTIPTRGGNGTYLMNDDDLPRFWQDVKTEYPKLENSCGCYVFGIRTGGGIKPWYVGKSQKQSFFKEVFAVHKKSIYKDIIPSEFGTPVIFLVAKLSKGNIFSRPGKSHHDIDFLENMLIIDSLRKNKELKNFKKTKFAKDLVVASYFNCTKKKNSSEKNFNLMLNK